MADQINVYTHFPVPKSITQLLEARLPSSYPILRRVQSASLNKDTPKYYRVVLVARSREATNTTNTNIREFRHAKTDDDPNLPSLDVPFTIAFVEFGPRPDTQLWIYSTFEDIPKTTVNSVMDMYRSQMRELVRELKELRLEYNGDNAFGQSVLLGSAHNPRVMGLLKGYNRYDAEKAGTYDKWLFKLDDLPGQVELPDELVWDVASEEDCRVAISHSTVPLPLETLIQAPNFVVKSEDGLPVCWGFLAPDGSLVYLHCKETHRKKGLAKTLVSKLFRERIPDFGTDGWASADVHADNHASRALCASLGGKQYWRSSWVLFDLSMA